VDAASYLASAAFLARIRAVEPPIAPIVQAPHMRREIAEGLRAVLHNRLLLPLLAALAAFNLLGGFFGALYSLYVVRTLELSPALLGVLISAGGVGALVGAASASRVTQRLGVGPALIAGLAVHGACSVLTLLAAGSQPQVTALLLFSQIAGDTALMIFFINALSLRQAVTPDRLLGRVNASFTVVAAAVSPVGFLLGGLLGEAIGVRPTLFIGAAGSWIGALLLLLSPVRPLHTLPTEPAAES
jgi:predicted MFS family arabinose efflux permease